jgi:uncharacterized protein YndB with AHSA1/START domain
MSEWSIDRETEIEAPIHSMWEFVAAPARVSRWWCAGGPVKVRFEAREGGHFEEHYDDCGYAYDIEGTVWAFEIPRRIAFRRVTKGTSVRADLIKITLSEYDGKTKVVLDHSFENLPENLQESMEEFYADGWSTALRTLRDALASQSS